MTGAVQSTFDLTTNSSSDSQSFTGLAGGAYTVTEALAAGYSLLSLSCVDDDSGQDVTAGSVMFDQSARSAAISLADGQALTCTFVNLAEAGITQIFLPLVLKP
jgi:hypothetical protein